MTFGFLSFVLSRTHWPRFLILRAVFSMASILDSHVMMSPSQSHDKLLCRKLQAAWRGRDQGPTLEKYASLPGRAGNYRERAEPESMQLAVPRLQDRCESLQKENSDINREQPTLVS